MHMAVNQHTLPHLYDYCSFQYKCIFCWEFLIIRGSFVFVILAGKCPSNQTMSPSQKSESRGRVGMPVCSMP